MFYVKDLLQEAKKNIFISLAIVLGTIFAVWAYNEYAGPFPIDPFALKVEGPDLPKTYNHAGLQANLRSAMSLGMVLMLIFNYWKLRIKGEVKACENEGLVPKGEKLYLWAWGLLIFGMTLKLTLFKVGKVGVWSTYVAYVLMIYKAFKYDSHSQQEMDLIGTILLICGITQVVAGIGLPFDWAVTIVCAKNVDFRKIIKIHFCVMGAVLLTAICASIAGFIPDISYKTRDIIRHSYGVGYPTNLAAMLAWEFIAGAYLFGKKYWHYVIPVGIALTWTVLKVTYGRLSTGIIALFLVGISFLILKEKVFSNMEKILDSAFYKLALMSMPLATCLSYFLAVSFNPKMQIFKTLDKWLSTRLTLAHLGIEKYGFSLFGQFVPINASHTHGTFFYLDCTYTNLYLTMGICFLVLFVAIYLLCCKKLKYDSLGLLAVIMVAVHGFVDLHIIELAYNPFSLALFAAVGEEKFLTNEE